LLAGTNTSQAPFDDVERVGAIICSGRDSAEFDRGSGTIFSKMTATEEKAENEEQKSGL
jgi:hypothetical protein